VNVPVRAKDVVVVSLEKDGIATLENVGMASLVNVCLGSSAILPHYGEVVVVVELVVVVVEVCGKIDPVSK